MGKDQFSLSTFRYFSDALHLLRSADRVLRKKFRRIEAFEAPDPTEFVLDCATSLDVVEMAVI